MRALRYVFLFVVPSTILAVSCRTASMPESELNLGFEQRESDNTPSHWYVGGDGYVATLDSSIVHGGRYSLHLKYDHEGADPHSSFGVGTSTFPIAAARGKTIRLSGWIRTKEVTKSAGLWLRVDGPGGVLAFNNMYDSAVNDTRDWKRYSFELPVDTSAININFGVLLNGHGDAWYDDLEIQLDSKPYVEPIPFEATSAQLDWLKQHASPIKTVDAGHGFDDLAVLHNFIGSAKIVGVGEATHGTSEFFRMKHRVLEYLVEKEGFNIFAIEANMPECERINEYVLTGQGDPKKLLAGIYFWTWDTQEVLDMIEWMHAYNASGKGRLQFAGFDMQTARVAADEVESYVKRADPKFSDSVTRAYSIVRDVEDVMWSSDKAKAAVKDWAALAGATEVINHLEANQARYVRSLPSGMVDRMIQNARIVEQAVAEKTAMTGGLRDSCMALNIAWIETHNPGARIMVWAHNGHISKSRGHMGSWLSKRYGTQYVNIGFAFNDGTYTAITQSHGGPMAITASPAKLGSLEYTLHATQLPMFFLNLRDAKPSDPNAAWLTKPLPVRSIGAVEDNMYWTQTLPEEYDGLIYIDHSTASHLLPKF
ncbi:MAG: erythromycin esterase family protein [Bacteroidota bacterium]|nr:erythromycin esterase family protein [Bacteroidota bacterium]MDP4234469.1 erythromycin esterase family protein [Bacteroidota bacterium]MDP4244183.1 erythromycin esterase family protein [Bacteroidota bacterium]MDP4288824.1 erythromycin esterase family protein [Bacteroidota bacterium]